MDQAKGLITVHPCYPLRLADRAERAATISDFVYDPALADRLSRGPVAERGSERVWASDLRGPLRVASPLRLHTPPDAAAGPAPSSGATTVLS